MLGNEFGFNFTVAENLFDGTSAEPVATQWATQGYNVIIGQGIQYQDMFIKIAPQFPNTLFLCVDCFKGGHDGTDPGNVGDVWWYMADGAYLMGMLAGNMTKSNKLGLVGGGRVPSIWAGHEAFKRGALAVNPKVTFIETWMPFSWADVAGAKKAAELAADQGADFIFSSGDGVDVGVRQAAQEKNIYCTGVYADAAHLDPAHIMTKHRSALGHRLPIRVSGLCSRRLPKHLATSRPILRHGDPRSVRVNGSCQHASCTTTTRSYNANHERSPVTVWTSRASTTEINRSAKPKSTTRRWV